MCQTHLPKLQLYYASQRLLCVKHTYQSYSYIMLPTGFYVSNTPTKATAILCFPQAFMCQTHLPKLQLYCAFQFLCVCENTTCKLCLSLILYVHGEFHSSRETDYQDWQNREVDKICVQCNIHVHVWLDII